jgi:hypothetical protein
VPLNTGWRQEYQYQFLETTNRVCPEVVEDLKKVRRGQLPFDRFSEEYGIPGTWIEDAARNTLDAWEHNPRMEREFRWRLPSFVESHLQPRFRETERYLRGFHLASYLFSPDGCRQAAHAALDRDFDQVDKAAASEGYTVAKRIPTELQKKLECAALYLFRRLTSQRLADGGRYFTDPTNMWRWVRDVFALLELPRRSRRNPARKNCRKRDL